MSGAQPKKAVQTRSKYDNLKILNFSFTVNSRFSERKFF